MHRAKCELRPAEFEPVDQLYGPLVLSFAVDVSRRPGCGVDREIISAVRLGVVALRSFLPTYVSYK
jgi:hypothetical protein